MKKKIIILLGILIVLTATIITVVALTGKEKSKSNITDNDNTEEKVINNITKIETVKEGKEEKSQILLNGKEHTFILKEDNENKIIVLFDNQEILSFIREYYGADFTSDNIAYKTVKGTDNQYYFALAISNFYLSTYQQYLFIFNDAGKIIYHVEDKEFGAAFTDYENITSFSNMYGDTGKFKIEEDNIKYLEYFNYTISEDFVRCQEKIITIDNDKVNVEQGDIVKVAIVA